MVSRDVQDVHLSALKAAADWIEQGEFRDAKALFVDGSTFVFTKFKHSDDAVSLDGHHEVRLFSLSHGVLMAVQY